MTRALALVKRGAALRVAAALGTTAALAICEPGDEAIFRAARRAGAKRLCALWDDALRDADYFSLAELLARAAQTIGFDVIVAGEGHHRAVAAAVADRLALPHLGGVVDARVDGERLIARRLFGGVLRTYAVATPAVLSVAAAPPAPPARRSRAKVKIDRLTFSALGISPAELAWRARFTPKPAIAPIARPLVLPDTAALVARLHAEGLLPRPG